MRSTEQYSPAVLAALCVALAALGALFIGWPINRDISTYAAMAQSLIEGKQLYLDTWDLKPPGIFATYVVSQWLIPSKTLQVFFMDLLPALVVLAALLYSATAAGFGRVAGVCSALFWIVLSNDTLLQTQEPNTETFINACCATGFLLVLRLRRSSSFWVPVSIGVLFGLAFIYKTVAIMIALGVGIAHLLCRQPGTTLVDRSRQLLWMAAAGVASIAAVFAYFAVTGRFAAFWEVMVGAGLAYAGDMWANVINGITFEPIVGDRPVLNLAAALAPWIAVAAIAIVDRERARAWVLLGCYAFAALLAVALPGSFYAHYFQLLVPAFCLGAGWVVGFALSSRWRALRWAVPIVLALVFVRLLMFESRVYLSSPQEVVPGTYQERYMETEVMARRLGQALTPGEQIYQWGEESGLYWFSGKRPATHVLIFYLFDGPQAERLTRQTLAALQSRPPELIIASNDSLGDDDRHPVLDWIRSNYVPVDAQIPAEREFFTYFFPNGASADFKRRVLGVTPGP